jgi:hypothetical protein
MQSTSEHSLEKKASASAIETAAIATNPHNLKGESSDANPAAVGVVGGPKFEVPNLNKLFFKKLAISAILITLVFWGKYDTSFILSMFPSSTKLNV